MVITAIDGYPDDPWIEKISEEMNQLVSDAERRIACAPIIGSRLLNDSLFARDVVAVKPEIFTNDPYHRINKVTLN